MSLFYYSSSEIATVNPEIIMFSCHVILLSPASISFSFSLFFKDAGYQMLICRLGYSGLELVLLGREPVDSSSSES